ncbi:RNA polymerase sigma factor [Amycolatopsis balhimycina]|nr:sigma factor-like helix-turn-helix DNA-binding protein [Amycolatopsis balhimycina]
MTGDDTASAAALAPAATNPAAGAQEVHAVEVAGEHAEPPEFANFEEYYRADAMPLVGFLMKLGAGVHDAPDIAQAVLVEMFRTWERIRSPRRWARDNVTWALYKMPVSAVHENLADVLPDSACSVLLSPEHYAEVAQAAEAVRALLVPLPEQQRLVMAYLMDGFTHREIAQAICTTPAAVAKAAARARMALKDRIYADQQPQEDR